MSYGPHFDQMSRVPWQKANVQQFREIYAMFCNITIFIPVGPDYSKINYI